MGGGGAEFRVGSKGGGGRSVNLGWGIKGVGEGV